MAGSTPDHMTGSQPIDAPPAFYRREGDRYVPTGMGVSPWNGHSQNGLALAGLAAHVLEQIPAPVPMMTARLTIDIQGVVPMEPLTAALRILRSGQRVQTIEVELRAGDRTWLRATALRIRTQDTPQVATPLSRTVPTDDEARTPRPLTPWAQTIAREGDFLHPGPGAQWIRFCCTVVEGAPLSPLERLAMLADFGSGVGFLLSVRQWSMANVDIALHVTRLPRGPWLLVDAFSESAGNGFGLVHARIGDQDGMIGVAHQTTFLAPRTPPSA